MRCASPVLLLPTDPTDMQADLMSAFCTTSHSFLSALPPHAHASSLIDSLLGTIGRAQGIMKLLPINRTDMRKV